MSFDSLLEQTREALKEVLPEAIEVTDIELEGPHIVLYTKQLDAFLSSGDLLRQVAQRLHRRVLVRSDPASLIDPKEAEKVIRELIPPEAEINQLFFEPETGEVAIEAANPGAAIGRGRLGAERPEASDRLGPDGRAHPPDPLEDRGGSADPPSQLVRRPPFLPQEGRDPYRTRPVAREALGAERPRSAGTARWDGAHTSSPPRTRRYSSTAGSTRARTGPRSSTPPSSSLSIRWTRWS